MKATLDCVTPKLTESQILARRTILDEQIKLVTTYTTTAEQLRRRADQYDASALELMQELIGNGEAIMVGDRLVPVYPPELRLPSDGL